MTSKKKRLVAKCSNCITCDGQCAKVCKCRGRTFTKLAKVLSDNTVKDWKLDEVGIDDPNFQDLFFAFPVPYIACGKFTSKEVKMLTAKQVQIDKERKIMDDPKRVPCDWKTPRKVVFRVVGQSKRKNRCSYSIDKVDFLFCYVLF